MNVILSKSKRSKPLIDATVMVEDDVDDKRVCYGSAPNSQFSLYKEEDDSNRQGWDIWFNDDAKSMESATITVDLNTMTWKYE